MTVIFKSNVAYAGASSVRNSSVITRAASDLYTEYAAMVVADGGTVSDPTECQAAIQSALDGDYYWRTAAAISPRWGRKVSGSDITKLYSLRGTVHAVAAGTVNLNTTIVAGEQLAELQAGDTFTLTGLNVLATGATGMGIMQAMHGAAASIISTTFTPAAETWTFNAGASVATSLTVAAVSKFASNPEYNSLALDSTAVMAEMDTLRTAGFLNGASRKWTTPSGGFTPLVAGVTANVVLARNGGAPYLGEWWLFNDVSGLPGEAAMMRATNDQGTRF